MNNSTFVIIAIACSISLTSLAQTEEFQIVDSLKNKVSNSLFDSAEIEVYPINKKTISCKKFEEVEVENPNFKVQNEKIESLIQDSLELERNHLAFTSNYDEYVKAKSSMQKFIDDTQLPIVMKLSHLKEAQKHLDNANSKIDFYRDKKTFYEVCGGKTDFKISQFILESQSAIDKILREGSQYDSKKEILSVQIAKERAILKTAARTEKVIKETGFENRLVLMVDSISIGKKIEGRFIKEDGALDTYGQSKYAIMQKDYREFVKNELVNKDSVRKYTIDTRRLLKHVGGNSEYLIKNVETDQLYYTTGDILRRWCMNPELTNLYAITDKLKIDRVVIGDKMYVKYNGNQCVLTPDVSERLLKKDLPVIKEMQMSVEKYVALNKSATNLALKLLNHIKSYKAHLLTYNRLDEWKEDTKNCEAVLLKMHSLPFASSMYFNRQLQDKEIEAHTVTIDYVNYSKEKLGL